MHGSQIILIRSSFFVVHLLLIVAVTEGYRRLEGNFEEDYCFFSFIEVNVL